MRKDFLSRLLRFLVWAAAIITMSLLILLVGYILINGIPHLKASLFDLNYTSDNVSMLPSIINTVLMTIISLLIAAPIGICSAIYLVEYAKRGNKLVEVVRITAETLSGIPSIVYVRRNLLCNGAWLGAFPPLRRIHHGDYDPPFDHANHRRSTEIRTGFLSGR